MVETSFYKCRSFDHLLPSQQTTQSQESYPQALQTTTHSQPVASLEQGLIPLLPYQRIYHQWENCHTCGLEQSFCGTKKINIFIYIYIYIYIYKRERERESLTREMSWHGSIKCWHLKQSQSLINICISGKPSQTHFCKRFSNSDYSFKLSGGKELLLSQ